MRGLYEELHEELERAVAFKTAINLFDWDNETLAPSEASRNTSKTVGIIAREYHNVLTGDKLKKLVKKLQTDNSLNDVERAVVKRAAWVYDWMAVVPATEYREFSELSAEAGAIWVRAKMQKKFQEFAPTLEKIIEYQKKFASYRAEKGESLYDTLLKAYDIDFNTSLLDKFFDELKEEIVPLLKQIRESGKKIDDSFLVGDFLVTDQEELGRWAASYMGFDFERGVLGVSAHPFTTAFHNHDVRMTTHYTSNMSHSLYSIIHETGHALYEFGIDDKITQTILGEGASVAMHESQSRFFENIVGKNPEFIKIMFEKAKEIFPEQLHGVSSEQFEAAISKVIPGPVRIDADELTYSLHILIRYEIEKMLIDGDLKVDRLLDVWNEKYKEYLLITPEDDAVGILQDIHWSDGSFGYFPSYALGSAISVQLYYHMTKEMDFDALLKAGRVDKIREYLKDHIHRYGMMKTSGELLLDTTGEEFNPSYYIRYLKEKYKKLYDLK